jgi:hypothetical protein
LWSALISATFSSSEYSALRENSSQSKGIRQASAAISAERVKKLSAGWGVDEHAVEVLGQLLQRVAQLVDLVARLELGLQLLELRVRGHHMQALEGCGDDEFAGVARVELEVEGLIEEVGEGGFEASTPAPSRYWVELPCGSRSTTRVRLPCWALIAARLQVIVDLPTPPF